MIVCGILLKKQQSNSLGGYKFQYKLQGKEQNQNLTRAARGRMVEGVFLEGRGFGMQKALVSVTGKDKPGIIAKVSTALFEMSINVLEISQTILDGYFTMLMIVDMTAATAPFADVAGRLNAVGEELGEVISIQRTDVFDAMHRI